MTELRNDVFADLMSNEVDFQTHGFVLLAGDVAAFLAGFAWLGMIPCTAEKV